MAPKPAATALGEAELKEMREIFAMFDEDGSGSIDAAELGGVLDALGVSVSKEKLAQIIREVDAPGGELDGLEVGGGQILRTEAAAVLHMRTAHSLTLHRSALCMLTIVLATCTIRAGDGEIGFDEFLALMAKSNKTNVSRLPCMPCPSHWRCLPFNALLDRRPCVPRSESVGG